MATRAEVALSAVGARTTRITLEVDGCDGCTVQAVQNRSGRVTYWGPTEEVLGGRVSFRVPTARTQDMALLVHAPFDDYAQDGIPMVVVTAFRAKAVGEAVAEGFADRRRKASGCWAGTNKAEVTNTLVVRERQQRGRTVAAGWLVRTWRSGPYWQTVSGGAYHVSDPSICA